MYETSWREPKNNMFYVNDIFIKLEVKSTFIRGSMKSSIGHNTEYGVILHKSHKYELVDEDKVKPQRMQLNVLNF